MLPLLRDLQAYAKATGKSVSLTVTADGEWHVADSPHALELADPENAAKVIAARARENLGKQINEYDTATRERRVILADLSAIE